MSIPNAALDRATFVDLLSDHAQLHPSKTVFTFLKAGEKEDARLSLGDLDLRARAVARQLQSATRIGDRALLLFQPGLDFVTAFFACLYAGVAAVPVYAPRPGRDSSRLEAISQDAQTNLALTTSPLLERFRSLAPAQGRLRLDWLAIDEIPSDLAEGWAPPRLGPDALAFLQYTSGSTGRPKGVMVSHSNLVCNSRDLDLGWNRPGDRDQVIVSWLPHFHDMGLIYGILQPVFKAIPCFLMSPASFLQRPMRWLEAISKHRGTHSAAPNFAYDLCVRRSNQQQRSRLDLSCWRVAVNGAEPVRAETLERFVRAFEGSGLGRRVFCPGYGLAEATLKVTACRIGEPPRLLTVDRTSLEEGKLEDPKPDGAKATLVGCGRSEIDTHVAIVDPESGRPCPQGRLGEIRISGPVVAHGYWRRTEETKETFGDSQPTATEQRSLRSGDLGFLRDGELFVAGRLKDLIIVRGRNHYPQDIEETVESCHPALARSSSAAFSIESDQGERLVIAAELTRQASRRQVDDSDSDRGQEEFMLQVAAAVRRAISQEHELQVHWIALLPSGTIPKTTSGKIQRSSCRLRLLEGELEPIWSQQREDLDPQFEAYSIDRQSLSEGDAESRSVQLRAWLCDAAAAILGSPQRLDPSHSLTSLGMDSLSAAELQQRLQAELGLQIAADQVLQGSSLDELCSQALLGFEEGDPSQDVEAKLEARQDPRPQSRLSRNQRALWFLHRMAPQSPAYNISLAVSVRSAIDAAALQRAVQALWERHPILRATFAQGDDSPWQQIGAKGSVDFETVALDGELQDSMQSRLSQEAHRPFDLEAGPLFRVRLLRQERDNPALLLSFHHIVVDLWSISLLVRELDSLYRRQVEGGECPPASQTHSYFDFVDWQEGLLESARGRELESFWTSRLKGAPSSLELPVDRPRPARQSFRGASHAFLLGAERSRRIEALARSSEATLFATLLAAFQALLWRYSRQPDFVTGSPVWGRSRPEFEETVGYFVNMIPLRARFEDDPSFADFLQRTKSAAVDALHGQDFPFQLMVERLQPERSADRSPLFQTMFAFQRAPRLESLSAFALGEAGAVLELESLTLESLPLQQRVSQFDLTLTMAKRRGELAGSFEYSSDIFHAETIERLASHFRSLLDRLCEQPRRLLSRVPLLDSRERLQVLADQGEKLPQRGEPTPYLHRGFERQARRRPTAEALRCQGRTLSYGQLNAVANRLARRLRAAGARPETAVGICLERSVESIVALLAVLKSGAAFLPLDRSHPPERLRSQLLDAQARLLIAVAADAAELMIDGMQVVSITDPAPLGGAMQPRSAATDESDLAGDPPLSSAAYIIYTSGSTGRPKGVVVSHQAIADHCLSAGEHLGIRSSDCVLQFASCSFDPSLEQIFPTLLAGGRLVVRGNSIWEPREFLQVVDEERISVANLPPAYWQIWAEDWATHDAPPACKALRMVYCSGEAMPAQGVSSWQQMDFPTSLLNVYGPTEAAVHTHCYRIKPDFDHDNIPIGRSMPGRAACILDRWGEPVPIGVPGELHLGGMLARGYHGRPSLTAERFLPDPFFHMETDASRDGGTRLYRSGDLCRMRADGEIEFLGRIDRQIQIRGFRVEPAEVEKVLESFGPIRQAAVVVQKKPRGLALAAFLLSDSALSTPSPEELKGFVSRRLPAYMVPSSFTFLASLPKSVAGKVDRKTLESRIPSAGSSEGSAQAPQTPAEKVLAEIWRQSLGRNRVGSDDNFFELGGDSIVSLQVVSRARRAGLQLEPSQIFQYQTLAELAAAAQPLGPEAAASVSKIADFVEAHEAPCLTAIQRWFFEQDLPDPHHYNQAVLLQTQAGADPRALRLALMAAVRRHDALRQRFLSDGSKWRVHLADDFQEPSIGVVDVSGLDSGKRGKAIEAQGERLQASLDLARGPLFRGACFECGPRERGRVLLIIHHLAVDGVSWRVLLEDAAVAYPSCRRGSQAVRDALAPVTTSLAHWSRLLQDHAQSAEILQELPRWSASSAAVEKGAQSEGRNASDSPLALDSADRVRLEFDPQATRELLEETGAALDASPEELVLCALAGSLSALTGRSTLRIDVESHGREQHLFAGVDLTHSVGWFTSLFPLRLESGRSDVVKDLSAVKESLRTLPNRGIGYGLLRYLRRDPDLRRRLQREDDGLALFNYLGRLDAAFLQSPFEGRAPESPGPMRSSRGRLSHPFEINAWVSSGRLQVEWAFSTVLYSRQSVQRLCNDFRHQLSMLHGDARASSRARPAGFSLCAIEEPALKRLLATLPSTAQGLQCLLPLTPAQEGMLYHARRSCCGGVYHTQISLRLAGELKATVLERAWQQTVQRHPALRTSYRWQGLDRPLQLIQRHASMPWSYLDWSGVASSQQDARLEELVGSELRQAFDLESAPAMRCRLIGLGRGDWQLVWSHHHLALDGWSLPIVLKEVLERYADLLEGVSRKRAEAPSMLPYLRWLESQDEGAALEFWKDRLQGFQPTRLPSKTAERGDSAVDESRECRLAIESRSIQEAARRNHLTFNTMLQGAFALVISRYCATSDVVFGAAVAGRPGSLPQSETTVGMFINTLPVRVCCRGQQKLLPWLGEIQRSTALQEPYSYASLGDIQSKAAEGGEPIFEAVLAFENYPVGDSLTHPRCGFKVEAIRVFDRTHYPFVLVASLEGRLNLRLRYSADRFAQPWIERFLRHVGAALAAMTRFDSDLDELPMLSRRELSQILEIWNTRSIRQPEQVALHHLFQRQTLRTPKAIAARFGDRALTYDQLNARSNRLARRLRSLGVAWDEPVALLLERSLELPVAVLAVMKAGAACLPLDPSYPERRLRRMLEESGAGILIRDSSWSTRGSLDTVRSLKLEPEADDSSPFSSADPEWDVHSNQLAYVLYTSGSTGRPKGVALSHRAVVNLIEWQTRRTQARPRRTLQFAPTGFDVFFQECFSTWDCGGALVLVDDRERRDFGALLKGLSRRAIERLFLPYVALQQLAERACAEGTAVPALEIVTAGEQLLATDPIRQFCSQSGSSLENQYGPSETHVVSSHRLADAPEEWPRLPPIGAPVDNTLLYVVDRNLRLLPVGAPGELCIGGIPLARGYLHQPAMTADRFVPDPFTKDDSAFGARLYRSGDLARWSEAGEIEFLGRIDQQLKIRGFRVEPGEIESVLGEHPLVTHCAVVAEAQGAQGTRLIAYVVREESQDCDAQRQREDRAAAWKAHLRERLPEYFVPADFVELERLPLTPSGKLSRKDLPQPEAVAPQRTETPPSGHLQELLAGVWKEVLGVEQIGANDDFFQLGGHSLLAARVASRLVGELGIDLPIETLFQSPRLSQLAQRLEEALRGRPAAAAPTVHRQGRSRAPLSFAQQRLWFLDRLHPGNSAFNITLAFQVEGALQPANLHNAIHRIVRRHEILRTRFVEESGQPVQIVESTSAVHLTTIELGVLCERRREVELQHCCDCISTLPFDLSRGPLVRVFLIQPIAPGETADGSPPQALVFNLHHMVFDGWSTKLMLQELAALCPGIEPDASERRPLPELPIQYSDFALWQREQEEALESDFDHWQRVLDEVEPLDLPLSRPRPPKVSYRGARLPFLIEPGLTESLRSLSRRCGATLFMTLSAGLRTLLGRYSGQDDFCIGTPVAGRRRQETESLIGVFINMLALRGDLAGNPTFELLVERERQAALTAFAHQDAPFERLVERLALERDPSRTPLFQAVLVLHNVGLSERPAAGCGIKPIPLRGRTAQYDILLSVLESPEGLQAHFEYRSDLFERDFVFRMQRHFTNLLQAAIENPHVRVRDLPMICPSERRQLLSDWERFSSPGLEPSGPVDGMIAEQALRSPHAEAIRCREESLSYSRLMTQADDLALRLKAAGLARESIVGVCLQRSPQLMAALLGVLRAGCVYLPLDPQYPLARLRGMLDDAQASALVAEEELGNALASKGRVVVAPNGARAWDPSEGDTEAFRQEAPEAAAYVLYTSGSSGRPKGVVVSHGAIAQHARTIARIYRLSERDRVLQFASASFDASLEQALSTLAAGACLVMRGREVWTPAEFLRLAERERLTIVHLPPAYWQQWVEHWSDCDEPPQLDSLRIVLAGGDVMPPSAVERWRALPCRQDVLVNSYGPTEATVTASLYWIPPQSRSDGIPIGRAFEGRGACILERGGQPAPVGVPGELHLSGGLARGYLGLPSLTAQRFVPDPFRKPTDPPGGRLYRSGDLCRWRSDGQIEFLGRIDRQVQIRGFRVELAEIEAALNESAQVESAAVECRDDSRGRRSLAAFLVWKGDEPANAPRPASGSRVDGLRRLLAQRLPEYMLPSAYVELDRLPLTPSGKVDRRSLSRMTLSASSQPADSPRTPSEELLCAIFSEALDAQTVGIEDDFFQRGGHSLLAMQVISRIARVFAIELPLQTIFENPSVSRLSRLIDALGREGSLQSPEPIAPASRTRRGAPQPLSFAQQRLWFLDRFEGAQAAYVLPAALSIEGDLDLAALRASLVDVISRHEVLRTVFQETEREPQQIILDVIDFDLGLIDMRGLAEANQSDGLARALTDFAFRTFDLAAGPLIRGCLILGSRWGRVSPDQAEPKRSVLLLSFHHIVFDGWSARVLLRELTAFYGQRTRPGEDGPDPEARLPELPVQYADYARWQRQWLEGERLEKQSRYWRDQLEGAPELLEIATDSPRPPVQSLRGAVLELHIDGERRNKLEELSRSRGATLFMTLLASYMALMHRYSGQLQIVVGTPIAGRNQLEVEPLIGFFVNTLALLGDLSGRPHFLELLSRVRRTALDGYANQDIPFEKLVEVLQPNRDLSRSPVFQTMFALQGDPLAGIEFPGLEIRPVRIPTRASKFDLSLLMEESPQGLLGTFEYAADLFAPSTISRLSRHFVQLIDGVLADPECPIALLPLLTAPERRQILIEWNETARRFAGQKCVHRLFEDQVGKTPRTTAVVCEGRELSYEGLNRSANRLANRLRQLGVGRESRVGVCLQRSLDLPIALMAVLKTGAAYVPLDPKHPQDRLATIIADSRVQTAVTCRSLHPSLPECGLQTVLLDEEAHSLSQLPDGDAQSADSLDNLCYIIFTSGSTGRPKGVMATHRGVTNRLLWMVETFAMGPRERFLQKSPFGFDVSVWEFFVPLISGGRLVLAKPEGQRDSAYLRDLIRREAVTTVHFVPSMLEAFLETSSIEDCDSLIRVVCSGEALPAKLQELCFSRLACDLFNLYGPTEASIEVSSWKCRPGSGRVPIGFPISNCILRIVDREGRLQPIGVPGELQLGGVSLARGYAESPGLTAERFQPDAYAQADVRGERLYRSGDLARYRAEGSVEFLGRLDHQIKIRGFRVELGEIEAVLERHPQVQRAVVLSKSRGAGDRMLVAYLTANSPDSIPEPERLRRRLASKLPEYMIPGLFVLLQRIPLTANGKVDRAGLPEPDWGQLAGAGARVSPRNPTESALHEIWKQVLGTDRISVEDSFFDLGGHSLLATQVAVRVRRVFSIELPLQSLFEKPTIAAVAEFIDNVRWVTAAPPPPNRQEDVEEGEL